MITCAIGRCSASVFSGPYDGIPFAPVLCREHRAAWARSWERRRVDMLRAQRSHPLLPAALSITADFVRRVEAEARNYGGGK